MKSWAAAVAEVAFAGYRAISHAFPLVWQWRARDPVARARTRERYGHASAARPAGDVVWVHAVSVGETNAVIPLVNRLCDAGFAVVLTTGTATAAAIAGQRLPSRATHQFVPLDAPAFVRRFIDHWHPRLAIFVESELWPTILRELGRRSIPRVIVNGRMSDRSFRRWRRVGPIAHGLFSSVDLCLAQSEEDARRFASLGAPRVAASGNLKWDAPPLVADDAEIARLRSAIGNRPLWLAASTHDGEEAVVAAAHKVLRGPRPDILTIIVPRHPARGDSIAAMLAGEGLAVARRSRGEAIAAATGVYLADTLGELGTLFRLAPIVFLGNSLNGGGGHNPMEPTQAGAAVLHGPAVHNFADVFARLDHATMTEAVTDAPDVARAVAGLLDDPALVADRARMARAALAPLGGALESTFAALRPFLAVETR
jgi:3-deoxy-D-manno-octulosonic-acid transferase